MIKPSRPIWKFNIAFKCADDEYEFDPDTHVVFREWDSYVQLYMIACPHHVPRRDGSGSFSVELPENDPSLERILSRLSSLGWLPKMGWRGDGVKKIFPVQRWWKPTARQLSVSPILWGLPGAFSTVDWIEFRGEVLVATPSQKTETLCTGIAQAFHNLLVVTQEFRDKFEAAGLKGAVFHPVEWEPRLRKNDRPYWLGSNVVLPRPATPLYAAKAFDRPTHVYGWDDDGYAPPVRRFWRDEVEAMGEFDVANVPLVGAWLDDRFLPEVLFSQRFRRFLIDNHWRMMWQPGEFIDKTAGVRTGMAHG